MESFEKSLKTSFVGAANHITQLYTTSLNFQKQSYVQGYNQATRDALEFILKQHTPNTRTIPVENLLEYLKNKSESNRAPFETNTNGPKSEVEQDITANEGNQSSPFFKFDNGFTPTNGRPRSTIVDQPITSQFTFGLNQQNGRESQQQIPNIFSFLPPETQETNTLTHDVKKRNFETPINSMDYCYPEQFYKKSRITG